MNGFRTKWLIVVSLLLCMPMIAAAATPPHKAGATRDGLRGVTVLIVRHAEKPRHGRGLSPKGEQRAQAYADYFDPFLEDGGAQSPQRLIAASNSWASKRSLMTLQPLSEKLGLPIEQRFAKGDVDELVASLRRCNKASVVLIAWHHGHLDKLVQAFGATSDDLVMPWPSGIYNWLIELRFDEQGQLSESQSKRIEEHVLPDDDVPLQAP